MLRQAQQSVRRLIGLSNLRGGIYPLPTLAISFDNDCLLIIKENSALALAVDFQLCHIGSAVMPRGVEILALLPDTFVIDRCDDQLLLPYNRLDDPVAIRARNARAAIGKHIAGIFKDG